MDEYEDCDPESDDLYANITIFDNNKTVIYQTPDSSTVYGDPINVGNGTTVQGPLPNPLAITGEHENDYIQFTYGSESWTSRDQSCSNGGWNPRDGPDCSFVEVAENQVDCCFSC